MQVKKEKPLGFSYTRRGVRKSLLVFLFLYFMLTFLYILSKLFPFFVSFLYEKIKITPVFMAPLLSLWC
mgnify:CR=1 FL=1